MKIWKSGLNTIEAWLGRVLLSSRVYLGGLPSPINFTEIYLTSTYRRLYSELSRSYFA